MAAWGPPRVMSSKRLDAQHMELSEMAEASEAVLATLSASSQMRAKDLRAAMLNVVQSGAGPLFSPNNRKRKNATVVMVDVQIVKGLKALVAAPLMHNTAVLMGVVPIFKPKSPFVVFNPFSLSFLWDLPLFLSFLPSFFLSFVLFSKDFLSRGDCLMQA